MSLVERFTGSPTEQFIPALLGAKKRWLWERRRIRGYVRKIYLSNPNAFCDATTHHDHANALRPKHIKLKRRRKSE